MGQYISFSQTSRKPTIQLGERFYIIFLYFGILMKLVRLIKMCLKCKVQIGKHLPNTFSIQNSFKEGDALLQWLFNFPLEYILGMLK